MGDKMTMVLLLIIAAGVVGGIYWFLTQKGNDVRQIDPSKQERVKGGQAVAKPTVAKTAQLSALRERLADAQTSSTGLKKLPAKSDQAKPVEKAWRPEEAGLVDAAIVTDVYKTATPVQAKPVEVVPSESMDTPVAEPVPKVMPAVAVVPVMPAVVPKVEGTNGTVVVTPTVITQPPVSAKSAVSSENSVHILLVDDSKVVRVKTEKLLVNKGYAVTTAIDGIDALAKLEALKPSIIITDIEMPNLDGFGLVRNVRGNLRTAEIPVIVMTSHVNLHLDIAATEGINGFLPKPFNDQDLLDQVAFLCES